MKIIVSYTQRFALTRQIFGEQCGSTVWIMTPGVLEINRTTSEAVEVFTRVFTCLFG